MKKLFLFLLTLAVLINLISAEQIFSDDFESGNLSAWNLSTLGTSANWASSTVNPYQGTYHAQSRPTYTTEPASRIEKAISTLGYSDITLSYYRRLVGLDTADEFKAKWYDGTTWNILEQTGSSSANDANYLYREYNLSSLANDNSNFQIRFECTAGATSEYCRVDNIVVAGISLSGDSTNPDVFYLVPEQNSNFNLSQIIEISANVADNAPISLVKAEIILPNDTMQVINLQNALGDKYNASFAIPLNLIGQYNITFIANDSSNNTNSTEKTYFRANDVTFPRFSDYSENPVNGSYYIPFQKYEFNATITELLISKAGIEFNGINYTGFYLKNISSAYSFNISNLAAGTYSYYWWANDTSGNYNTSGLKSFLIGKAQQPITLLLNGNNANLVLTYPQQINVSYSGANYTATITRINSLIASIARNYTLAAGDYLVNYSALSNQNYSSFWAYLNLTINRALQTAVLGINETSPIDYGRAINVTCNGELFRNNIDIASEKSKTVILGAGFYNYSCKLYENQNYTHGESNSTLAVNRAMSMIEMYLNGTAGNQTGYYGVQTNVSVVLGNSEQTAALYKNGIDNSASLEVYQALEIGDYNFTAVAELTQNYSSLVITRWVHILCQEILLNSSWSDWADDGSCMANDLQQQVRNTTQYDSNSCGYANTTIYEYQNISCDYCTPDLVNTTKSEWYFTEDCQIDDTRTRQRNWTEYDLNNCGEFTNITYFENEDTVCDYCTPNLINSSWSEWTNLGSCLANDIQIQIRSKTQYDFNNCGEFANETINEYQNISCDFCIPSLTNTTKSEWYFTEDCQTDDTRTRQRNWTEYDSNNCGEFTNITYFENDNETCDFLLIDCEVGGHYQQGALALFIGNVSNFTSYLVNEDVNITLYQNGEFSLSKILQTSEDGDFETSFLNLSAGNYQINASISYLGANETCTDNFQVGSAGSLVLDKTANIHNLSNTEIDYNISLRVLNKGESDCINVNLTDLDSEDSSYYLGSISPGQSAIISYLKSFVRQNTTAYYSLDAANVQGIDSYSNSLIFANSSLITLNIPASVYAPGKQLIITKNILFVNEESVNITYNVSSTLYNSGDEDLTNLIYTDTDISSVSLLINISRGNSVLISNLVDVQKAASNIEYEFELGTAVVDTLSFYSNRPKVKIPGYGGPADLIVHTPKILNPSESFNAIIEIKNMNLDIGQDFPLLYWITNNDETINYTSGQRTLYVASGSSINTTVVLISPSLQGNYKLKAFTFWPEGTAFSFSTFEVISSTTQPATQPAETGEGGSTRVIPLPVKNQTIAENETKEVEKPAEQLCNFPYIRLGERCCLDANSNLVCDNDEVSGEEIQGGSLIGRLINLPETTKRIINQTILFILIVLIALIILVILLVKRLRRESKKSKNISGLKRLKGLKVYSSDGLEIGKIEEIFLEGHKIEGFKIKLQKKKKFKLMGVIIRYGCVEAIKDIVIVNKNVLEKIKNE